MKLTPFLLPVLMAVYGHAQALDKSDIKTIIEEAYPKAKISEIDKETYKGKRVYEVDFLYDGKKLEAIVSRDGTIIKVDRDD
jgi:uncharacterized membrane protein YkoI